MFPEGAFLPFSALQLHPDLLRGLKELGFTRPTPIQADAIPPALAGRDVLACAMTGSGKTAAFLLPILHQLIGRPRGATRALVLTPTRELAAQILEDLNDLAVHTPLTGAAVFGGVGMGPQEHAFRSGVDVIVATPGRLLDHFRQPYAKLAGPRVPRARRSRPHARHGLPARHPARAAAPARRSGRRCSSARRCRRRSPTLSREMLQDPVTINLERQAGAGRRASRRPSIPVPQDLKSALLRGAAEARRDAGGARLHAHQASRQSPGEAPRAQQASSAERIHGNRSQAQRTEALAGFKSGKYRVLVATDIAARGIDVEALGHVVNFDVPPVPEDYIHRVGRTARAEATGDAFTFVSPEEESDLRGIERAIGKRLPRVTVPDFDYKARAAAKLEVPLAERIAAIRARKAEERARARAKAERRGAAEAGRPGAPRPGGAAAPGGAPFGGRPSRHRSSSGTRWGGPPRRSR